MGAVLALMGYLSGAHPQGIVWAARLIPAALVFDVLDGRVARWRQQQSALGRELDSLADAISFGVAPAAMAFACGMNGFWDCAILIYFVACGVSRLARYNITADTLAANASGKVKYFEGTPIPSSLLLVAMLAIACAQGRIGPAIWLGQVQIGPWMAHPLTLTFALSGSLMISKTLRIPKL